MRGWRTTACEALDNPRRQRRPLALNKRFSIQVLSPMRRDILMTRVNRGKIMKRVILALWFFVAFVGAAQAIDIMGVVVQGNGDKAQFERALKLASNMHEVLNNTKFEVVVFGPTVQLLTAFSDEVPLIQKARNDGIKVIACGRSLKTDNVKVEDLVPGISVVPFGAVYIVERQQQGWQYFKP